MYSLDEEGYTILYFKHQNTSVLPVLPNFDELDISSDDDSELCYICYSSFTRKNPEVICSFCTDEDKEDKGNKICRECVKMYLLSSTSATPHCINCKKDWSTAFMYANFKKTFIDKIYRNHLKNVFLDREKSRIPETLSIIQQEAEKLKLLTELNMEYTNLQNQIHELQISMQRIQSTNVTTTSQTNFLCKCPNNNCKGMIESRTRKCVLCMSIICKDCREILSEEHECNLDTVKTVELLQKDTKGCPKCATQIFKISGCDQMWCTQCQVAFSWKTGREETGTVHNPHYYQFIRQNGGNVRNLNDIPCGGLIDAGHIEVTSYNQNNKNVIQRIHRLTAELNYQIRANNQSRNYETLRRKYIQNKITEDNWKQSIFIQERSNARKLAKQHIYVTLRTVLIERLIEVVREPWTKTKYKNFISECNKLRVYVNKSMADELKYIGGKKMMGISPDWKWINMDTNSKYIEKF